MSENFYFVRPLNAHTSAHSVKVLMISFIIAFIFVHLPWELIRGTEFADAENYIARFNGFIDTEQLVGGGNFLSYISSEFLWVVLIQNLQVLNLNVEDILLIFSFVTFSVFIYFLFISTSNFILTTILIINPLIIDFVMSQVRNSFALSIIIIAFLCKHKQIRYILLVISSMIHSSSLIFIVLILILDNVYYIDKRKNFFFLLCLGLLFGLVITEGRDFILELLGDRRSGIVQPKSSFLFSVFWILYFSLMIRLKDFNIADIYTKFSFVILVIFVSSVFFGTYASRYLAVMLPFLIISTLNLKGTSKYLACTVLFMYQILQFSYWIN